MLLEGTAIGPAASPHTPSSVDCITTTSASEFSVHTAALCCFREAYGRVRLSAGPEYTAQVEALRRLWNDGSQFVRGEHLHVNERGRPVPPRVEGGVYGLGSAQSKEHALYSVGSET